MVDILIDKLEQLKMIDILMTMEQLKNDRYIDDNAVLLKLEHALYIIRMQ